MYERYISRVIADTTGERRVYSQDYNSNIISLLGLDSLDCIEIVMALEEEKDVVIEDDALIGCTTISQLSKILEDTICENI